MRISTSMRWLVVAVSAAMLFAVAAACDSETIEVPGETVVVEKEVIKEVQVPGETVVVREEVVKTVEVPGETVVKEVVKEVQVPGETVVVEKEVVKTVEVPGETVVVEKTVEVPVESDRFTRNVWGQLVETPQYGGSIPIAVPWMGEVQDPIIGWFWGTEFVFERLADMDLSLPRDEAPYLTPRYLDMSFAGGLLAERWEHPDDFTYVFHIRPGVSWHDKAPVNGRELDAYDVEFSYQRALGMGSGYTEMCVSCGWLFEGIPFESITATDERTVVVKTQNPGSIDLIRKLVGIGWVPPLSIVPPEAIEQHGDFQDWENLVGTGPFQLTGVVSGSSLTFTKNPNYWMVDPIHPDLGNHLPYADEVVVFGVPDVAARAAALRTGKTALIGGKNLNPDQIFNLERTNPELVVVKLKGDQTTTPGMRLNRPPFDDINVRIAMQKAINAQEINFIYYNGLADATPWGYVTSFAKGMNYPYSEWPEELRWQYAYDAEEAEKLLDEAGFTRGADGIRFKADWHIWQAMPEDIDLAQLVTSYWDKIGVDVTIYDFKDGAEFHKTLQEGRSDIINGWPRHFNSPPMPEIKVPYYGEPAALTQVADTVFNDLIDQVDATTDWEEYKGLIKKMDQHYIKSMWTVALAVVPQDMLHQPWLKGYRGERGAHPEKYIMAATYAWIDEEMKKEMGH